VRFLFAVGGGSGSASCFSHPNAGGCSPNSSGAEIFAVAIVAAIVVLAILGWVYRRNIPTGRPKGRLMRVINSIVVALARSGRRP
jgi:hypothetical protein